jgi:hypothetical protein
MSYKPRPIDEVEGAIKFARENFCNDGAEGETVHLLCDELQVALRDLAVLRAELKAATECPTHYESNGEAGDGQTVCDYCGTEVDDDGHQWPDCVKCLTETLQASNAHVEGFLSDRIAELEAELQILKEKSP